MVILHMTMMRRTAQVPLWTLAYILTCSLLPPATPKIKTADYWANDFDKDSNCKRESEIGALEQNNQCAGSLADDDNQAFQYCKINLSLKLLEKCKETQIKQAGEIIYCKKRGQTKCCFTQYVCEGNWGSINSNIQDKALAYLDKKEDMFHALKTEGYKSCHAITGYNASVCADDCETFRQGEFAKKCQADGGLFKCCIRRDKAFCDECRYCCTLPFCTKPDGKAAVETNDNITQAHFNQSAIDKLYPLSTMYKGQDYRCYDPLSNKDPEKWKYYYDQKEFREAKTEQDLKALKLLEFDKRIINFEDPEVFKTATGKNYKKFWKEVYGFDYVNQALHVKVVNKSIILDIGQTDTLEYCLNSESQKFAKECRKKKGFFKCCTSGFRLDTFHQIRHEMFKKGFLKTEPEFLCGKDFGDKKCQIHTAVEMCTTNNPLTAQVKTEFKTPLDPKFEIGGLSIDDQNAGLRLMICVIPNTCSIDLMRPILSGAQFKKATDQNQLCEDYIAAADPKQEKKTFYAATEDSVVGYYNTFKEYCNKTEHTVFLCPEEEKNNNAKEIKHLRQVLKEHSEKSKKKGRSRKKSQQGSKKKKQKKKKGKRKGKRNRRARSGKKKKKKNKKKDKD